jgi:hypothetical protein
MRWKRSRIVRLLLLLKEMATPPPDIMLPLPPSQCSHKDSWRKRNITLLYDGTPPILQVEALEYRRDHTTPQVTGPTVEH